MRKDQEIADSNSCLNRASGDEPVFVLRAKDDLGLSTVANWIRRAQALGVHQDKMEEAHAWLDIASQWRRENGMDPVPDLDVRYPHRDRLI